MASGDSMFMHANYKSMSCNYPCTTSLARQHCHNNYVLVYLTDGATVSSLIDKWHHLLRQ